MWGRILQILCAGWLAASPLLLSGTSRPSMLLGAACALLVTFLAVGSFHRRVPHLHVATVFPALWLIGGAFLAAPGRPPLLVQSNVIIGLMLLILVLVPNHATSPPRGWDTYNERYRRAARN